MSSASEYLDADELRGPPGDAERLLRAAGALGGAATSLGRAEEAMARSDGLLVGLVGGLGWRGSAFGAFRAFQDGPGGEMLAALVAFLAQARTGALGRSVAQNEARAWIELGVGRWPFGSPVARAVLAALTAVLAEAEPATPGDEPLDDPPASGALECGIEAVLSDPAGRAGLLGILAEAKVVLPVVDVDFEEHPGAARYRFPTTQIGNDKVLLGFTSRPRFDALAAGAGSHGACSHGPGHVPANRVELPGRALAGFWPSDHWLVLNPGSRLSIVFSPAEILTL